MVHYLGSALASKESGWEANGYSVEERFRYYIRTLTDLGLSKVVPIFKKKGESFCFRLIGVQDVKKSRWSHWIKVEEISKKDKSRLNHEIQMCLADFDGFDSIDVRDYSLYEERAL